MSYIFVYHVVGPILNHPQYNHYGRCNVQPYKIPPARNRTWIGSIPNQGFDNYRNQIFISGFPYMGGYPKMNGLQHVDNDQVFDNGWKINFHQKWLIFKVQPLIYQRVSNHPLTNWAGFKTPSGWWLVGRLYSPKYWEIIQEQGTPTSQPV